MNGPTTPGEGLIKTKICKSLRYSIICKVDISDQHDIKIGLDTVVEMEKLLIRGYKTRNMAYRISWKCNLNAFYRRRILDSANTKLESFENIDEER